MSNFIEDVVSRNYGAGYLSAIIPLTLQKRIARIKSQQNEKENLKSVVVPYYHTVSNNLKAISKMYGVQLVFKNDFRLRNINFPPSKKSVFKKITVNQQVSVALVLCMKYLWLVASVTLGKQAAVSMRSLQSIVVT